MAKRRQITEDERQKISRLWRLGANRNFIAYVLKLSHDSVQNVINDFSDDYDIEHNQSIKRLREEFKHKARTSEFGTPASNYRKQHLAQLLHDYMEEDKARFDYYIKYILSPQLQRG